MITEQLAEWHSGSGIAFYVEIVGTPYRERFFGSTRVSIRMVESSSVFMNCYVNMLTPIGAVAKQLLALEPEWL